MSKTKTITLKVDTELSNTQEKARKAFQKFVDVLKESKIDDTNKHSILGSLTVQALKTICKNNLEFYGMLEIIKQHHQINDNPGGFRNIIHSLLSMPHSFKPKDGK